MASPPTTTIPMEIDTDHLPADIPEAQAVQPEHEDNDDDGNDATTSKRKAPRKPRSAPTKLAERAPGTTSLPVARVKRILGADEDLQNISKEALFLISIATEQFLKRMADSAYLKARMDGRKTITMKDLTRPETLLQPGKPTTILPHPTSPHATLAQPRFPRRTGSTSEGYVQGESIGEEERSSGGGGSDWPVKRGLEAEQDADESGVAAAPVPQKKAVKAKPKARKSAAAVDPEVKAGLEKTLAEHSAKAVLLGRPKPVKKAAPAVHDLRSPSVEEAPVEVMDDDD
ncbi:hypothetical protein QFC20_006150 [Naganishia adeliensis]|uniref:Uncharacterized protein n=1 Tax=Naganishia adeliensis TaxID=92952 RepID=A0ACC2VF81_9TREE|nr:hypothetical protein QFC20_006150 [Naganishia adeliensis]